jgi:hypothetical protein
MKQDMPHVWRGGCLCGAVRYEVTALPRKTSFCHCEDCRRASGAPVVAWTFFPAGTLQFVKGDPCKLHLADRERTFCGDCGTPLTFYDPTIPTEFEVTTCSLDEERLAPPPADHNWTSDVLPWLRLNEDLPAFEQNAPVGT